MRRLLALAVLFAASTAFAQEEETQGRTFIYKSVTTLDIEEGADISAEVIKPPGTFLFDRKRAIFRPMIELRRDFNDALETSVDEVR